MNFQHLISFSPNHSQTYSLPNILKQRFQHDTNGVISRFQLGYGYGFSSHGLGFQQSHRWKFSIAKKKKSFLRSSLRDEPRVKNHRKRGSVAGAVALIIGTSIGTGILALPKRTYPAGLFPSSISMTLCWAFLLIEALLLAEINVGMLSEKKKLVKADDDSDELEVISIRTMAQETLGVWGGALATTTYVFLGYSSMVAYCSKSGEILHHFTNLPESVTGAFFTAVFTILISVGGTRATDNVNQWLTVSMIGLLIAIEFLAVLFGGWSGFDSSASDWGKVPATLPVMIFALVYHDLAPVVCSYLEGDLTRIRASFFLGSVVPLLALLIWEAIALGLSNHAGQDSDPVKLLLSVGWDGVSFMVEAFSLLAVGTSLIGTLLSFSEFFKEQLNNLTSIPTSGEKSNSSPDIINWWEKNRASITATAMVVAPSLAVSTAVPDAFSAATDIAGGYCMTMLYGVLPPAMALAMNNKRRGEESEQTKTLSKAGPALVGVGLFACGIMMEQILEDFSLLRH